MNLELSIYLADDHELVAHGFSNLLRQIDGVHSVQTFKNGKDLFNACFEKKPDIIFLDYEMPIWNGKETLTKLKIDFPKIPILMLSMLNEKAIIQNCISLGASGYLNKDCSLEELNHSIDSVFKNEIYYSVEVLKSLEGLLKKSGTNFNLNQELSDREMEILALLCDGFGPKEIAENLFLSPRTVETHKNNIMQKFDVSSVSKLISIAIKNRIV